MSYSGEMASRFHWAGGAGTDQHGQIHHRGTEQKVGMAEGKKMGSAEDEKLRRREVEKVRGEM